MPEFTDLGKARIEPAGPIVAGSRGTWQIIYTCGAEGIAPGGGVRLVLPNWWYQWETGKITCHTDAADLALELLTEGDWPLTFHLNVAPVITVRIWGRPLRKGESIVITLGEPGAYVSGFFVRARAQEFAARGIPFGVWVDPAGNGSYNAPRYFPARDDLGFVPLPDPPTVDVIAGPPARLQVTATATPRPGEPLRVTVAALDEYDNAAPGYCGTLAADLMGAPRSELHRAKTTRSDQGRKTFHFKTPEADEILYASVGDWEECLIGKSHPICPGWATGGNQVFFGEIHHKTANSDGIGTCAESYAYARDVAGLDFSAVADHEGGRDWPQNIAAVKECYEPGRFVSLLGFEHSSSSQFGHRNVYYLTDDEERAHPRTPQELWAFLKGKKALVVPHHTNTYSELGDGVAWQWFDWNTHNARYERLVEICQNRGSFECDEPGENVLLGGCGASARDALALGARVGFIGGTDNHAGEPGSYRNSMAGIDYRERKWAGLAAVYAKELTREAVWRALWNRHCYATNGARILLDMTVNGKRMGSEVWCDDPPKVRRVEARAVGVGPIARFDVIRNGEVVHSQAVGRQQGALAWEDHESFHVLAFTGQLCRYPTVYYYVRVVQEDSRMAWSSPVWFGKKR